MLYFTHRQYLCCRFTVPKSNLHDKLGRNFAISQRTSCWVSKNDQSCCAAIYQLRITQWKDDLS